MNKYRDSIIRVLAAVSGLIFSSYISTDIGINGLEIPFSLQSLAVFVIASFLPRRMWLLSIMIYLLLGITGLPVFAGGTSGLSRLTGPTGGFLVGFIFSGYYISKTIYHNYHIKLPGLLLIMLLATIILFALGLLWLSVLFNFQSAIEYGLKDFWIMALIKAVISTFVVKIIFLQIIRTKNESN